MPSLLHYFASVAYPVVLSRPDLQEDRELIVQSNKTHEDPAIQGDHVTEKFMPCIVENCSKCQIKDSEIRQLRKRVQALEEQLCRALGSKENSSSGKFNICMYRISQQSPSKFFLLFQ